MHTMIVLSHFHNSARNNLTSTLPVGIGKLLNLKSIDLRKYRFYYKDQCGTS